MANQKKQKQWTVMVYMAGDNNLDPDGVKDLLEMKKVGSNDDLNIIAEFDRDAGHVASRYYLRQGGAVSQDTVGPPVGKVNTGDPKFLMDFIQWGIEDYPAEHYLLILWNHGQGWDDTDIFADDRLRNLGRLASRRLRHAMFRTTVREALKKTVDEKTLRAILIDDDSKDFLDNQEMKDVLTETAKLLGRKLDILGMDACLMSMAEVGYQISGSADYTVGSEEVEPGTGWPYDTILGSLAKNPKMKPQDLSALIVDKYLDAYSPTSGVTMAACDLSKAESLATAVAGLGSALTGCLSDTASCQHIQSARNKVQCYEVRDNIDLVDFCSLLAETGVSDPIASACKNVIDAAKGYVIKQGYKGTQVENSNGVAMYFPLQPVSPLYPGLELSKKTGWDAFLKGYQDSIGRRPRKL